MFRIAYGLKLRIHFQLILMRRPVVDIVGFGFSLEKMCFVFVDVDLNDKNTWKKKIGVWFGDWTFIVNG